MINLKMYISTCQDLEYGKIRSKQYSAYIVLSIFSVIANASKGECFHNVSSAVISILIFLNIRPAFRLPSSPYTTDTYLLSNILQTEE